MALAVCSLRLLNVSGLDVFAITSVTVYCGTFTFKQELSISTLTEIVYWNCYERSYCYSLVKTLTSTCLNRIYANDSHIPQILLKSVGKAWIMEC